MSCQAHRGFMPLTDCIYCLWAELEALRADKARLDWVAANVGNVDFHVKLPSGIWGTNPFIAIGSNLREAIDQACAALNAAKGK